jgi:hypothetical protein
MNMVDDGWSLNFVGARSSRYQMYLSPPILYLNSAESFLRIGCVVKILNKILNDAAHGSSMALNVGRACLEQLDSLQIPRDSCLSSWRPP